MTQRYRLISFFYELFLVSCGTSLLSNDLSGYYWRDYKAALPPDAISGGIENGLKTYLGQVLFRQLIVPAKIVPENNCAYFEWGKVEYNATENVKILCTAHPEYFHWIKTGNRTFKTITDKHFVVVALEPPDGVLYFGRRKSGNDIVLGKVLVNKLGAAIHVPYQGGSSKHYEDFEVLYYELPVTGKNPNKNTIPACSNCEDRIMNVNLFC